MTLKTINTRIFYYATLLLAAAIPFSARLSTWCIILLAVNWLVEGDIKLKIKTAYQNPVTVICSLFYLIELSGLVHTNHFLDGFYHAQNEASFLVFPLLFLCYQGVPKGLKDKSFNVFCLSVLLTSLYCVYVGIVNYHNTSDISYLFYHTLVAPIHQHAVYFSIYTFICVVWLFHSLKSKMSETQIIVTIVLLIYFCGLLFLLRSKMLVGIIFLFAVYQLIKALINNPVIKAQIILSLVIIIGIVVTLCTVNPVSNQFSALNKHDLGVLQTNSFDRGDYFDEVQLRLLLWKFTIQILNDSHQWLLGVSPGDARYKMNEQIVSHTMYTGIDGTADHGYLNYNDHNQYFETLLRSGLIGLLVLLSLLLVVIQKAISTHNVILFVVVLSFSVVFLTESVLERQFGIVPFFFFICLLVSQEAPDSTRKLAKQHG